MTRRITPQTTLDNLKKEAKRWLKALQASDSNARTRFQRAHPKSPAEPTLRDVQYALAREYGLDGWIDLRNAVESKPSPMPIARSRLTAFSNTRVQIITCAAARRISSRKVPRCGCWSTILRSRGQIYRRRLSAAKSTRCGAVPVSGIGADQERDGCRRPDRAGRIGGHRQGAQPERLGAVIIPVFHAIAAGQIERELTGDREAASGFRRGSEHLFHGGRQPVHAAGRGDWRGRRESSGASAARRIGTAVARARRKSVRHSGDLQHSFPRKDSVVHGADVRVFSEGRPHRRLEWDPAWHMLDMGGYGSGARWHLWIAVQKNDFDLGGVVCH